MAVALLRITDFRNLAAVELAPCLQGVNIIDGNNGSGKTSLLEAIYYLGLGRSFRTSSNSRLIHQTSDQFSLFAQLVSHNKRIIPVGMERTIHGLTRLRIEDKDTSSIAELASFLPMLIIHSQSHQLFESGPIYRRKFLDWGLFYQSESFLSSWRQFERVLKQRNALLKAKRPRKELDVWTNELVKYGLELDALRRDYIRSVSPFVAELAQALLGVNHLEFIYQPGWDEALGYAATLANVYEEEYRMGHTQFGPHRADFDIQIDTISVKHFLSRGQQKLLICAMILAQGKLLAQCANKGLIYLIDDLPTELDLYSKTKLISLLTMQQAQIFITAIESDSICHCISDQSNVPMKVFHVEHGRLEIKD